MKNCRLCGSNNLAKLDYLKPIEVGDGIAETKEISEKSKRYAQNLYFCQQCSHLQQEQSAPTNLIWSNNIYLSSASPNMKRHFEDEAKYLKQQYIEMFGRDPDSYFDIAANDGSFIREFKELGIEKALGIDPALLPTQHAKKLGLEVMHEYFNEKSAAQIRKKFGSFDIVTMYNAFAHIDNLDEVIKGIKDICSTKSLVSIEVQYLGDVVKSSLLPTFFHEHLSHHSIKPLKKFFEANGLRINSIRHFPDIQNGSIIMTITKTGSMRSVDKSVEKFIAKEEGEKWCSLEGISNMFENLSSIRMFLKKKLVKYKDKGRVIAFGASRSSTTIIRQMELDGLFSEIYDESRHKIGKFLLGTDLQIKDPIEIKGQTDISLIINFAWSHNNFISKLLREKYESKAPVLVIFPDPRIENNGVIYESYSKR